MKKFKTVNISRISFNRIQGMSDDYIGLCLNCGNERDCTEPDASDYPCDNCKQNKVVGSMELLFMKEYV